MLNPVDLVLARLPAAWDGLTVAVVADLHAGCLFRREAAVREIVALANSAGADLVALLGDLVHWPRHADRYVPLLAELRAPLGVWACLGNHEHWWVWHSRYLRRAGAPLGEVWRERLAACGVRLLLNEAAPLERGGERLWLAGVDDAYSGRADLATALREVPVGECCLALSHSPDVLDDPLAGRLDLILAGHTHGGQVHLPGLGPLLAPCRRPRERAAGLVEAGGTRMYVSRGVGEGLPLRIGCPRELPVVRLRRA